MHIGIHHVLLDHIVFDRGVGIDVYPLDHGQKVAHGVSLGGLGGIDQGQTFADALSARSKDELAYSYFTLDIIYHPEKIAADGVSRFKYGGHPDLTILDEIAKLLYEFGYINCLKEWLRNS